ncbi:MAG TPA: ChbG/HpnK family deacetylase [Terriglobia bacterium]|nr:ChbG/HpnK family deacetylase [Terriglobia bacterium]
MKRLIVNADDFGYTRGVNRAIVDGHRHGIITSTSLMANGAAFEEAVALAEENPALDVGCHLNLVEGIPVSDPGKIPHLVGRGGRFHNLVSLGLRVAGGRVPMAEVEREFSAQVEKILAAGIRLTHLDTHQHTHLHPEIAAALARVGRRYGIGWVRRLCENCTPPLREGAWRRRAVALASYLFVSSLQRQMDRHGLRTPDAFTGFVLTGRLSRDGLRATLAQLPEGITELMCHPGYCDAELIAAPTMLKTKREAELRILADASWREWLRERGVVLTCFRDLSPVPPWPS